MRLRIRGVGTAVALVALTCGVAATSASAALRSHGQVIHIVKPGIGAKTNQSNNWFGYNQGTLEQGGTMFHSISGDWTVPTASSHTPGTDDASSDWIGIGGGCIDASCTVGDPSLTQTETEQ